MKKACSTGRVLNRWCDTCGRWLDRSNYSRLWTVISGHRLGNQKDEAMICRFCLTPKQAEALVVARTIAIRNGNKPKRGRKS